MPDDDHRRPTRLRTIGRLLDRGGGGGEVCDPCAAGLPKSEGGLAAVDPLAIGTRFVSLLSGTLYGVGGKRTGEDEPWQLAASARAHIGDGGGELVGLATFVVSQITGEATELVLGGTRVSVRPDVVDEKGVSFRIGRSSRGAETNGQQRVSWGSTAAIDLVIEGKACVLVIAPTKFSDDEQGYRERSEASDKVVAVARSNGTGPSEFGIDSYGRGTSSWGHIKTIYR